MRADWDEVGGKVEREGELMRQERREEGGEEGQGQRSVWKERWEEKDRATYDPA